MWLTGAISGNPPPDNVTKPVAETVAPIGASTIASAIGVATTSAAPAVATAERLVGPAALRILFGAGTSTSAESPASPTAPVLGTDLSTPDASGLSAGRRASGLQRRPLRTWRPPRSGRVPVSARSRLARVAPFPCPAPPVAVAVAHRRRPAATGHRLRRSTTPQPHPRRPVWALPPATERRITWRYPEVVVSPG
jgi:hypothetical protein